MFTLRIRPILLGVYIHFCTVELAVGAVPHMLGRLAVKDQIVQNAGAHIF